MAEHGAGHLGEKALDEIKPRAVLGREHEAEPALALTFVTVAKPRVSRCSICREVE